MLSFANWSHITKTIALVSGKYANINYNSQITIFTADQIDRFRSTMGTYQSTGTLWAIFENIFSSWTNSGKFFWKLNLNKIFEQNKINFLFRSKYCIAPPAIPPPGHSAAFGLRADWT